MGKLDKIQKVGNWVSALLLGETKELIARIDERTLRLIEDIKDIKPKVDDMSPKVDVLWKDKYAPAGSPRQLNEVGEGILNSSGIKEIIERTMTTVVERGQTEVEEKKTEVVKSTCGQIIAEIEKQCNITTSN